MKTKQISPNSKTKKPKTAAIRGQELFTLVYGKNAIPHADFEAGWIRLGKFVLALERKWSKAKLRVSASRR